VIYKDVEPFSSGGETDHRWEFPAVSDLAKKYVLRDGK